MTVLVAERGVKIIVGDCAEVADSLDPGSVDCIVTSPPYWRQRDYTEPRWEGGDSKCKHSRLNPSRWQSTLHGTEVLDVQYRGKHGQKCPECGAVRVGSEPQLGQEATAGEYVDRLAAIASRFLDVLSPSGTFWLNVADTHDNGQMAGVPWALAFALRASGWRIVSDVVWWKPSGLPEPHGRRPTKTYEHVFLLTKTRKHFYSPRGGQPAVRDVWAIRHTDGVRNDHGALFPVKLARTCIRLGCPPDGTVLDPFFGLGTTGVAARELGVSCIGIEQSPRWAREAAARLRLPVLEDAA